EPLRARLPELPPALEAAVHKALAKEPKDRFEDALAFSEALDEVLVGVRGGGRSSIVDALDDRAVRLARTEVSKLVTGSLQEPETQDPREAHKTTVASIVADAPTHPPRVGSSLEGTTFDDKYEVLLKIGEGATGAVFRARHKLLD